MPVIPAGWLVWLKWGAIVLAVAAAAAISGSLVNSHWHDKWLKRDAADLKAQVANAAENERINSEWAKKFSELQDQAAADRRQRESKYEKDLADYRNGNLRLRAQFTCYRNLSETAAAGQRIDDAGKCGLSDADVEFLIRFAKEANRLRDKVTELQGRIKAIYDGMQSKK